MVADTTQKAKLRQAFPYFSWNLDVCFLRCWDQKDELVDMDSRESITAGEDAPVLLYA